MFCHYVTFCQELVNHLLLWTMIPGNLTIEQLSLATKNFAANSMDMEGMVLFMLVFMC